MTKKTAVLKAKGGQKIKVDAEDLARLEEYSWRVTEGTTGRLRVVTSVRTADGPRSLTLGKFLMKPKASLQVYPRRFNDELDYRKENLIVCTLQERQRMLPKKKVSTSSQYRGVSFVARTGKWRAGIEVEGKSVNLGSFESEDEAALAYNKAARKHFGGKAYQNPVERKKERRGR